MLLFETIGATGIIPVVSLENPATALPLAEALSAGGLSILEITFRTAAAARSIASIKREMPGIIVGAGTVLTAENLSDAIEAGADFIVAPGSNPKIMQAALDARVPMLPGVVTPTEIECALSMGFTSLKFFPCEAYGGIAAIRALSAPYPTVRFVPTGGVNLNNVTEYLGCARVLAVGGSWMAPPALIKAGDFRKITEMSLAAVALRDRCRGQEDAI